MFNLLREQVNRAEALLFALLASLVVSVFLLVFDTEVDIPGYATPTVEVVLPTDTPVEGKPIETAVITPTLTVAPTITATSPLTRTTGSE